MKAIKALFSRILFSVVVPSGIVVASVYIFYDLGNFTFILASVGAFAIGAFVVYLVFKYWIDPTEEHETPQQQQLRFMIIFVVNLAINTEIVYFLVTYAAVPILTAQTVAAVIVAYESYYAYRSLVFYGKKQEPTVGKILAAQPVKEPYER